tara:strand:+ start:7693 stop:7944 length:252 start_codon:yes stop_codon:yes gene_type:complete
MKLNFTNKLIIVLLSISVIFIIYIESIEKNYTVILETGKGVWKTYDYIPCDSVNFVTKKEVNFWNNGVKTRLLSENIIRLKGN